MIHKYRDLIRYPADASVIDIRHSDFQTMRCGDMVAVLNVIEHLRQRDNRPDLRFHILSNAMFRPVYIRQFRDFLMETTDYLSDEPSGQHITASNVSAWNYRGEVGDLLTIRNPYATTRKVAIFPLLGTAYNVYRNWTGDLFTDILDQYRDFDGERVICIGNRMLNGADAPVHFPGFTLSYDFMDNVRHALSAEIFVGGDSGFSHLVGAVDRGPMPVYYYHGVASELRTLPIGYQRRGRIVLY